MGNRVGIILHDDWEEFSPLFYSHHGAESTVVRLQKYLQEYVQQYDLDNHDGHLYNPEHMMVSFLQCLDKDIHIRVENLSEIKIKSLQAEHEYRNCFDGGCWIVNVSTENFGETVCGDNFILENDNIVNDKLKGLYDDLL